MRIRLTYRSTIAIALLFAAMIVRAEPCHKNMLVIPDRDSYISVDAPKQLPTGALTLECWADATANIPEGAGLIEYGDAPDTGAFSFRFVGGNQIVATLRLNTGIVTLNGGAVGNVSIWHHYAVTFIPGDSICIYVDGTLTAGMPTNGTSIVGSYNSLFIGRSPVGGNSFVGNIDELRIWNVARTIGEIAASKAQPLLGDETGLRVYLKFDDDPAATNVHDFSSHFNSATYTGTTFLATSTAPIQGAPPNGYMLASKDQEVIFPPLLCGTSEIDTVRVYNRGDEEIQIDHNGFLSGKIFSISSTIGFPLPPGDTTRYGLLLIQANATIPGDYTDTLVVVSSTVCGGEVRVAVRLHKAKVSIAFQDSIFFLHKLLNCNLPLEAQTHLKNTGGTKVTITSLGFIGASPIAVLSPGVPFTLDSGAEQEVRFQVTKGAPTLINATLRATTQECSRQATISFQGERLSQSFSVAPQIVFPTVHDPATAYTLFDTLLLKNTGTSDLYLSPGMQLFGSSAFRLISPLGGLAVVRHDSTFRIVISFNVAECGSYQASLTLHLQDARDCPLDTSILISATVLGPDLATIADTIDLGAGCSVRDTTIMFYNRSGRQITVGRPLYSIDGVMVLQNPGVLPKQLADGDSVLLRWRFAPTIPGEYSVDTRLPLAPCGDKRITFSAIFGVGEFTTSDSVVDFSTGCDLTPSTQTINLRNLAGKSVTVTDTSLKLSESFTLVDPPLPFTMADGESRKLTIRFTPTSLGVARGEIWIFENGCFVKKLVAKAVREHTNVGVDSSFVEFGTVCPGDSTMAVVTLTNRGFGDVWIDAANVIGDSVFHLIGIPLLPFARGETRSLKLRFAPNDTTEFGALLQVIFGPCGDTAFYSLHGIGGPNPRLVLSDTVLDFASVRVGTQDTLCLLLTNPSCIPIPIVSGTFGSLPPPFTYQSISVATAVDATLPIQLCVLCSPDSVGTFTTVDTIRSGMQAVVVTIRCKAIAPKLVHPTIVDFGSVPITTSTHASFKITNLGDADASVTFGLPAGDFVIAPPTLNVDAHTSALSPQIDFRPTSLGVQTTILTLQYDNSTDTVLLRGRGVGPGPLFSVSDVAFGPVRLLHRDSREIAVTSDKPTTITNVRLQGSTNVFSVSPTGTFFITNPNDTLHFIVSYQPIAEIHDTTTLLLSTTTSEDVSLSISGDGVEAHLAVSDSVIDFGNVALRSIASTGPLTISNTGSYPLVITSASHASARFGATTDSIGLGIIAPHSDTTIVVSFSPRTDAAYLDTLIIVADAPEHGARVTLRGVGVFAPFGYPHITFALPHLGARVGDVVDVPIELGGSDLDLVDIDSFTLDIAFDPTVVYFRDTISETLMTNGWTFSLERRASDTIRIVGHGPTLPHIPGVLCSIRAEALLGPRDSTALLVGSSDPRNSANVQSSTGSFVVTDCGNYRGGIVFAGNYSLAKSIPSPSTGMVAIPYELGLPARVRIDLYDQLGHLVRTLFDGNAAVGGHVLRVDLSDLPKGEYHYVLHSLEYNANEKLMLIGH